MITMTMVASANVSGSWSYGSLKLDRRIVSS